MAWKKCCCGNCVIYEDDFNRPAENRLNGSWCERPGSWRIEPDENKAASITAGAPAMVSIPHPAPDGSMIVHLFITWNALVHPIPEGDPNLPIPSSTGQRWRIIVNSQKQDVTEVIDGVSETYCAPLSYYYAEAEATSSTTYTIRLGMSAWSAGTRTETELKSRVYTYDPLTEHPPFGAWMTAKISDGEFCVNLGLMYESCGSVDFAEDPEEKGLVWLSVAHPGLFTNGYYCGMQMSQTDMYVTQFSFREHFKTLVDSPSVRNACPEVTENPRCDYCFCTCGNEVTGDVEILPDIINYRIRPADASYYCSFVSYLNDWHCYGQLVLDSENARWIQVPIDGKNRKVCCQQEDNPVPQEFIISFHCPAVFQDDPEKCPRWYLKVSGGGVWPPPVGDKPGVVGGCCLVGGNIIGSIEECIIPDTVCNWQRSASGESCRSWTFCYPSAGCSCPKLPDEPDPPPQPPDAPPPPPPLICTICVDIWW